MVYERKQKAQGIGAMEVWLKKRLKDKLRHVKNFKSLFEHLSISVRQHQIGHGWGHSATGGRGRLIEMVWKQNKEIIDSYSLKPS